MTMRLRSPVIVLLIAGLSGALSMRAADTAGPATFFMASAGNDNWSGRLALPNGQRTDGPFATLQAACRAARGVGTEPRRTIVVQAGEYFLNDPVSLTNRDSGLQIVAAPGAAACLYGARRVQGWQKDGEKFYAADLPGVKEGTWDFRTLIVNQAATAQGPASRSRGTSSTCASRDVTRTTSGRAASASTAAAWRSPTTTYTMSV